MARFYPRRGARGGEIMEFFRLVGRSWKVGDWVEPYKKPPGWAPVQIVELRSDRAYLSDGTGMHTSHLRSATPRANPDLLGIPIVVYTEDAFTGAWKREGTMTLGEFLERNDDIAGKKAEVVRDFKLAGGTYTHRAKKDGDITWRIEIPGGPHGRRR